MLTVTIDRVERSTAMVELDEGRVIKVAIEHFPARPREGEVYQVPLDARGEPIWSSASRDREEEERRMKDVARRMDALRKRDAGGDVEL
jgi:hypothetical protein